MLDTVVMWSRICLLSLSLSLFLFLSLTLSLSLSLSFFLFPFTFFPPDCTNGQVRLMGGDSDNVGSVEVCFDNVWGNLEETGWGGKDAQLVCNLLGYLPDGTDRQ